MGDGGSDGSVGIVAVDGFYALFCYFQVVSYPS